MIIYSPISVILALPEKEEDNRSILIKGMKMPKNCRTCPCFQYEWFDDDIDGYCNVLKIKIMNRSKRHSNCPLAEISLIENVNKIKEDF